MAEKYICTKETLKNTIEQYGVAIIPNVIDEKECESMYNHIWDFFTHITREWDTPLSKLDTTTWREFYKLYPLHSMLIQYWGVGQCQASWNARQHPKILEIFSYFWGCNPEDLLVSFDGLSLHLPPEITKKGWNRGNTWYHIDQSFTKDTFQCIQSFITTRDINEYDATLSVMEGSNKYHKEFCEEYNIQDKSDWCKISKTQEKFYLERGCAIKNITCPKGSLVFWDSRTIHCGIEADKRRDSPNVRAIIYLCYMPRVLCDSKNLKKKQKAFAELRTTNHYPCKIKLFPKAPRTYGNPLPSITTISEPMLSDIGKKLAGF